MAGIVQERGLTLKSTSVTKAGGEAEEVEVTLEEEEVILEEAGGEAEEVEVILEEAVEILEGGTKVEEEEDFDAQSRVFIMDICMLLIIQI